MLKSLGAQQTKNLLHNICKSNGDVDDVSCCAIQLPLEWLLLWNDGRGAWQKQ
jgi:hypothetical protein